MFRYIPLVLCALLPATSALAQEAGMTMGPGFIGPVNHTMSEQDIVRLGLLHERSEGPSEGGDVVVYDIHVKGGSTVTLVFGDDGAQQTLRTESPAFMTPEGARIGDTLETLRKLYPDGVFTKDLVEGAHVSFSLPEHGASRAVFMLDAHGLTEECFVEDKGCPNFSDRVSEGFETWDWPPPAR